MTDREAMKMAFNALLLAAHTTRITTVLAMCAEATDALRQALAQPEQSKYSDIVSDGGLDPRNKFDAQQEPVAWMDKVWMKRPDLAKEIHMNKMFSRCQLSDKQVPLYTAPLKQWVGLTEKERDKIILGRQQRWEIAHMIEAKLQEKNGG